MARLVLTVAVFLAACAHPRPIAPRPADVATVDGMMTAFYDVVNVGPTEPRQWDRDRTLYAPWLRFVAIAGDGKVTVYDHAQFIAATEPLIRNGFRERELWRTTRRYGNMVHVDSTYETLIGASERSRGVNSVDLYFDGKRWWIASVVWQSESSVLPIPETLLPPVEAAR